TNAGPTDVTGANMSVPVPANLTNVTWTCVGTGGATCAASGMGAINDSTAKIPAGGKVTYTVKGTVANGTSSSTLKEIATITDPAGVNALFPANNSAGDNDPTLAQNGIGCTANTDCVSGVCDPKDNKCGDANGDGPCTPANAGKICRSGACSVDGNCMPAG